MSAQAPQGTALLTAAAGRIGRAIATRLAPAWTIVLQETREHLSEAEEVAQRLGAAGGRAAVLDADLGDVEATGALVERAAAAARGPVTLLVNAATLFAFDHGFFNAPSWAALFAVNLRAPCQLADRFAAAMPPGAQGAIVNLVDRRLWQDVPGTCTYELSQAALGAATATLARTHAPHIRVNAVGPPRAVASAMVATGGRDMPLAGPGAPAAIAKAVDYLARAASLTGQTIAIDPDEKSLHAAP